MYKFMKTHKLWGKGGGWRNGGLEEGQRWGKRRKEKSKIFDEENRHSAVTGEQHYSNICDWISLTNLSITQPELIPIRDSSCNAPFVCHQAASDVRSESLPATNKTFTANHSLSLQVTPAPVAQLDLKFNSELHGEVGQWQHFSLGTNSY